MPEIDVQVRHDDGGTLFYYTEVLTLTRWVPPSSDVILHSILKSKTIPPRHQIRCGLGIFAPSPLADECLSLNASKTRFNPA